VRTTIRLLPRLSEVCPERRLAVAIFSQAANDLQKFRCARCEAGYSLYTDARKWITSDDRLWPYSFLNLCDALHLASDVVRAELLGGASHSGRSIGERDHGSRAHRSEAVA